MANDMRYLSAEEEAKLLKPIDEYVGKIQAQIDALRVDGSDQVQALKTHISLTKEDKNYTKEEQNEIILKDQALLVKAREVEGVARHRHEAYDGNDSDRYRRCRDPHLGCDGRYRHRTFRAYILLDRTQKEGRKA